MQSRYINKTEIETTDALSGTVNNSTLINGYVVNDTEFGSLVIFILKGKHLQPFWFYF